MLVRACLRAQAGLDNSPGDFCRIDRLSDRHEAALAQAAEPGPLPLGESAGTGFDQLNRLGQAPSALQVLNHLAIPHGLRGGPAQAARLGEQWANLFHHPVGNLSGKSLIRLWGSLRGSIMGRPVDKELKRSWRADAGSLAITAVLVFGDGILPVIFRNRLAVMSLLAVLLLGLIALAKSVKPPAHGRSREDSDSPAQQWRTRVVVCGSGGRLTEPSAGSRSQRVAGYSP